MEIILDEGDFEPLLSAKDKKRLVGGGAKLGGEPRVLKKIRALAPAIAIEKLQDFLPEFLELTEAKIQATVKVAPGGIGGESSMELTVKIHPR